MSQADSKNEEQSLARKQQLDQICDRFEGCWQAGEQPRLEDFLPDLAAAERGDLLRELIQLDIFYRRQRGFAFPQENYTRRFPELDSAWLAELCVGLALEPAGGLSTVDSLAPASTQTSGLSGTLPEGFRIPYLGNYEILEKIGQGGMGVVYRGRDPGLQRSLAIKVLSAQHQGNALLKRRFLEEARIMGQLQHPGVAPIHEVGQLVNGQPFFAMKQIQGQTLADLLKKSKHEEEPENPLAELPQLLSIFELVCQTLAYAHHLQIIHRDLKPANIMAGAFGEVQVMDWGLAKVLCAGSEVSPRADTEAALRNRDNVRTGSPEAGLTETGMVLGTLAYMAPEQARGEVEQLDERCDVFGLGAILCEILTGSPPFAGDSKMDSHRRAMKADLVETFARLKNCAADAELVQLAQHCLAAEKQERPRHAREVAEAVAQYQTGVRERLRRAEVERAEAQVKAAEERKRRRLSVLLAGLVVVFVLVGAGAGIWYYHDWAERIQTEASLQEELSREKAKKAQVEAERLVEKTVQEGKQAQRKLQLEKDLTEKFFVVNQLRTSLHLELAKPLGAAKLLSDIYGWRGQVEQMREGWKRAAFLVNEGKELLEPSWHAQLIKLNESLQADEANWAVAKKLDKIREETGIKMEGKYHFQDVHQHYNLVFQELILDVEKGDLDLLIGQVKASPLRYALVAALDHWVESLVTEPSLRSRLLKLVRAADPDPWRDQVRHEKLWGNPQKLLKLAKEVQHENQTPQILILLAQLLNSHKQGEAVALLRQSLLYHPKDFWLHFHLGGMVHDPVEGSCRFQAALALRPESAPALNNLGNALRDKKDLDGAIVCLKKAIDVSPKLAPAHYNLGNALRDKKDLAGAFTSYQTAIKFDPDHALAHNNLGLVLLAKKNPDGAMTCFQKAIQLDRNFAGANHNLGNALRDKNDLTGAMACYKRAIVLDPKLAVAHYGVGNILKAQGALDAAIDCYKEAIRLDPKLAPPHHSLGNILYVKKNLEGAIAHFQAALVLDSKDDLLLSDLGLAWHAKKDYPAAIDCYKKALDLDPNNGITHYNLGNTLYVTKVLADAIVHYQKTIAINPGDAQAHCNLGHALRDQGKFADSLKALKKGHELGFKQPGWSYPSAQWVKHCEKLVELDQRLPAILQGTALPRDAAEQLALAELCYHFKKFYVAGVRFYADAFAAEPKLVLVNSHRYHAACTATLAAAGQGKDADKLDEPQKAKLRQQALAWLKAELAGLKKQLTAGPNPATAAHNKLKDWQTDPDLAGVREADALTKFPEPESREWQTLWAEVSECLKATKNSP